MSGFLDIPERKNGIDQLIEASWFNTIRTKLIEAFGTGGYIKVLDPVILTTGASLAIDATAFKPLYQVESDGGAVVISSTPFGVAHGFTSGKEIVLLGLSDVNTVTIEPQDVPGGFISNGKVVLTKFVQVIYIYNGNLDRFIRQE